MELILRPGANVVRDYFAGRMGTALLVTSPGKYIARLTDGMVEASVLLSPRASSVIIGVNSFIIKQLTVQIGEVLVDDAVVFATSLDL